VAKPIDWIKLKNEYIHSKISYRKLAAKHKISESSVKKRAKAENWVLRRKEKYAEIDAKVSQETEKKITEDKVKQIIDIIDLNDKLALKIDKAIGQLEMVRGKGKLPKETGMVDVYRLRQLVQSLKNLNDIKSSNKNDNEDNSLNVTLKWE